MFKLNEIKELIKIVDKSSIEQLEIENEGTRLYISKPKQQAPVWTTYPPTVQHSPAPVAEGTVDAPAAPSHEDSETKENKVTEDQSKLHQITSPMVGTFYAAPSPNAEPYVKIGDRVEENTVVCIVEAMKLMNEIEAEVKGEIVDILVGNAELVEFGQPLFLVKLDE